MRPAVLMYHSISARGSGGFERKWVLPQRVFRAHLDLLRLLRIPVLPIDALLAERPPRGVILTFDDAYADFATAAWPLLRERGYPAAVMVPTEHVGHWDVWNAGQAPHSRRLMDWPTLRQLRAEGVAIESHSATHADLRAAPLDQVVWELRRSRERLAAEMGEPPRFLAYPYNRTSPEVMRAAREAGYLAALGSPRAGGDTFNRRRYDMSAASPPRFAIEVLRILDGARQLRRLVAPTRGPGAPATFCHHGTHQP